MFHRRSAIVASPKPASKEKISKLPIVLNGDNNDKGKKDYSGNNNSFIKWCTLSKHCIKCLYCTTTEKPTLYDHSTSVCCRGDWKFSYISLRFFFIEFIKRIIIQISRILRHPYRRWKDGWTTMTLLFVYFFMGLIAVSALYDITQYYFLGISKVSTVPSPVIIQSFFYRDNTDVGGFLYPSRRLLMLQAEMKFLTPIIKTSYSINKNNNSSMYDVAEFLPDYGGIYFPLFFNTSSPTLSNITVSSKNPVKEIEARSKVTAHRIWTDDDFLPSSKAGSVNTPTCRHPTWHKLHYPNCNNFHEMDMSRRIDSQVIVGKYHTEDDTIAISHGYYRDAWLIGRNKLDQKDNINNKNQTHQETSFVVETLEDVPVVLKTLRYPKHAVNEKTMTHVRKDALIMERLTSSPRIVDIYGYCGTSMRVEYIDMEVEESIVTGTGYIDPQLEKNMNIIPPRNSFTAEEKLHIALAMAESLADLHGFKDGVIVHDDVQLCQWLRKKNTGQLKLGDFNRAGLMLWDEARGKYCKYSNGECYGNYRAPEEFAAQMLDESIDVYSFGNNIYALLTGLWVFYTNEDDSVVQKKVIKGERAFIHDHYRNHSFIENKLIEVMEKCWIQEPEKRINIFDAIKLLRQALLDHNKLKHGLL